MGEKILTEERKRIQFDILVEIDRFCRENDIQYYLTFGTLLGAVRHKGFIPWDDDIDIMMTWENIEKFKSSYSSPSYSFIDASTDSHYMYPFPRLVRNDTYCKYGKVAKSCGVFVDIYSINAMPNGDANSDKRYLTMLRRLRKVRLLWIKGCHALMKVFPVNFFYGIKYVTLRQTNYSRQYSISESSRVYISSKNIILYDKKMLLPQCELSFEGHRFYAPKNYHEMLSLEYGDYMKLPPENQRHPYHGDDYYWN